MPQWIDYKQLKREIAFADVLDHYSVQTKTKGEQAKGKCPLPAHESGGNARSFSVNLDRNIFQCFGCGAKGNVMDFIALMEKLDPKDPKAFRKAAVFAKRKFLYTPQHEVPASSKRQGKRTGDKPRVIVNPPLDFELQGLDAGHPWFEKHGLTPETVRHFGLGYCKRGLMKGRIAIPLHDHEGQLIGYAGRLVDESKIGPDNPKYLLPDRRDRGGVVYEFKQTLFLYGGHLIKEPVNDLVVVAGFTDVWWIWQVVEVVAVALMGSSCGPDQADLIIRALRPDGRAWIMTDGNDAGKLCARNLLNQLTPYRFARWVVVDNGKQPIDYTPGELCNIIT